MVTIARGWWSALEPTMLAFTVVVCGGAALLVQSPASAIDRDHQAGTSGAPHWAAASHDSVDDGDDDGDDGDDGAGNVVDAIAAPIVLTADDDSSRPVIQAQFDVALTLRPEQLATRGPPDRTWKPHDPARHDSPLAFKVVAYGSPSPLAQPRASAIDAYHQAGTSGSDYWLAASQQSLDDGDDDGDDDDDSADDAVGVVAAPIILTADDDSGHPVIQTEFGVLLPVRAENLAVRGPPDRNLPTSNAHDAEPQGQDSSDVDDDDDDDDDDDASDNARDDAAPAAFGRSAFLDRGQIWTLILPEFNDAVSFASADHSLRAPPQ